MQRHGPQIGHVLLFGLVLGTAMAENIGPLAAMRAQEIAHILDQPQNRHIHALEHGNAAPRINQSQILRRRHDHRPCERDCLRHCELRIARAGRHIDHQHIKLAPIHLAQHLLQGRHHHGAAPNHRGIVFNQKADGHGFHPIGLKRFQHPPFADNRLAAQPQQPRQGRTIDIGIQHTDFQALRFQRQSQIDRSG